MLESIRTFGATEQNERGESAALEREIPAANLRAPGFVLDPPPGPFDPLSRKVDREGPLYGPESHLSVEPSEALGHLSAGLSDPTRATFIPLAPRGGLLNAPVILPVPGRQ